MKTERVAHLLFFFSGLTSLIYQVVWMRELSLFFGSDVYAASITLGVFMSGLALGGVLGGVLGDRVERPMLLYGIFEIIIGVWALLVPTILFGYTEIFRAVYQTSIESAPTIYQAFRVAVSITALLVPTLLMGATLPLLVRQFSTDTNIGGSVASFYSINTFGAMAGTLCAGFVLLPNIGVKATTITTAAANLIIGLAAFALVRTAARPLPVENRHDPQDRRPAYGLIGAMACSSLASLALEVVWTRILVQSFSATVYGFSIMLASFLFGIYYGSKIAGPVSDITPNPRRLFSVIEAWLAASVALLIPITLIVPGLFGSVMWALTGVSGGNFGIGSTVAQIFVATLLMVVPTSLLGATFPIAVRAYIRTPEQRTRGTGLIYAASSVGGVVGATLGGFLLLPHLGMRGSLAAIAVVFMAIAIALAWKQLTPRSIALPGLLFVGGIGSLYLLPPQTVLNFNMQQSTNPDVLYHGDGVSHTIDIVRSGQGHIVMVVNGNIEADTTLVQRRHFILKAHLPLVLHEAPRDTAIVGLGLGMTTRAILNNPAVENVRLVELSPEMVVAHRTHPEIAGNVLGDPKLKLRIDDGRNFMSMSAETFDMITADPIHPRISGVGYLYTKEYYDALKARLNPKGVVLQWMPMYGVSLDSFNAAFRTFTEVFPHASFWYVRGHGLFLGGTEPLLIDGAKVAERTTAPAVAKDLATIGIGGWQDLLSYLLMDETHIRAYLAADTKKIVNTDDNAYLEYKTPNEFLHRTHTIVEALKPYAGWESRKILVNTSEDERLAIERRVEARRMRLSLELDDPID